MAEDQVIITRFEADLSGLEEGVNKYAALVGQVTKSDKQAEKSQQDLSASTGSTAQKFNALTEAEQRNAKAAQQVGASSKQAATDVTKLGTATQSVSKNTGPIGKLGQAFNGLKTQAQGVGNQITKSFAGVGQSIQSSIPQVGGLGSAFSALTGPIGIAATAVVGFLANFSRLDSVQVFFDAVKIGFDQVGQRLTSFDGFKGLFDPKQQAQDAAVAANLAQALDDIEAKSRDVNLSNAEAEKQLASLNQQLRDRTKTEQERLAIADEITAIENDRAAKEAQLAKDRVNFANAEVLNQIRLGTAREQISDDILNRQTEALVAQRNAEAQSIQLTETVERRRNAIIEQAANERAQAEAKSQAARDKAIAEQNRRNVIIEQQEKGINDTLNTLAQQRLDLTLSDQEREVAAIERKYAEIEQKTRDSFAKLKEVTAESGQTEVAANEARAIIAIEQTKNAQLEALQKTHLSKEAEQREAGLEKIRQSLLTDTEAQREEILKRFDEQSALADQFIEDEIERARVLAELKVQAEKDLTAVLTEEQQKQLDQERAAQEQRVSLAEQNATIISDFAVGATEIVAQAAAGNEDIARNASKVLTTLLLDTLEKIIIANAFQVQAISAGSPDPANVATGGVLGIARGAVLAGLVKALFAVAKAAITGAYLGERYIGEKGDRPMWTGKDGYLRRVHKGERIVTAKDNEQYWEPLEAIRKGTFDKEYGNDAFYTPSPDMLRYIEVLGYNDDAKVTKYVESDTGQRLVHSVMPAMFSDKGIVESSNRVYKETRKTNDLLALIAHNFTPRSKRAY